MRWWKPRNSNPSAPLASCTILVFSGCNRNPRSARTCRHQFACLFGLAFGGGEDDEVVGVSDQHSQPLPFVLPALIQNVQRDVREQWRSYWRSLRGPGLDGRDDPALEHPRSKPAPQQLQHSPVTDPPLDPSEQGQVIDLVKTTLDVGVEHPRLAPVDRRADGFQRMMGRQLGTKPIACRVEVGFEDRLEHDPRRRHHHPVGHRRDPERPRLPRPTRLRDPNPPQRPRPIPSGTQPLRELVEKIAYPGALDLLDGHAIDASGSAVSTDLAPRPLQDVAAGDLVKERMETTVPVLLGTAVKHALEGTNTIHTKGATDRPSL